jgi:ubiquinone/menaquinone biosynthesis C-methylase UbiE
VSTTEVRNPLFARLLVRMRRHEPPEQVQRRRELLAGMTGRVLDLGAGDGANFEHFPPTVTEVVAVEPEPYLRERARENARRAAVPIEVVDGLADRLPLEDASVDAAVTALVLCSVPDQAAALAELHRVIRPGGELRFFEHVVAEERRVRALQRAVDGTGLWPRIAGGCHTTRDTGAAIAAAGFAIERCERLAIKPCPLALPVSPHLLGVARRPPA